MSTSTSDETVTPSLLLRLSTTDTSATTTACNTTFSNSTGKDKAKSASFNHPPKVGRKAFRRLPIPSSLLLGKQEESARLGYGLPFHPNDEEEEEFPQSPGNSPLSRFKPSTLRKQRHRSASEASLAHNQRQLHPSPPQLLLQPEDLRPKRKVLVRKPIPISLLLEADETTIEKQRSWSVPELYSSPTDSDDKVGDLEKDNSLGLYLSTPVELESLTVGGTDNTQPQTSEGERRLRRVTRSISDSHSNTHARGVGKVRLELGVLEGSDSNSSSEEEIVRGRVRSGSLPSPPSPSFYSTQSQPEQVLRRVSRTQPEMMRSEFLSNPSPPSHYEMDAVEVLTTPDPSSLSSFPAPYHQYRREGNMSNSLHLSTHDQYWDSLRGTSSRSRSNSETTLASLLLLQQHIQQRNWLRQFAPPSDPHLPPDFGSKRMSRGREPSEEEMKVVEAKDGRRKDARVKAEGVEEEVVRKYGAMRIRGWVANEDQAEIEQVEGGARRGLRLMFSNPILGEAGGSLRERRAKPPIRIALSAASSSTGTGMGEVKRKQSKTILSPTTAAVHSPPPCPPPATPLPDLPPPPKSAPLTNPHPHPQAVRKVLVAKRSFIRSSSTPVSPINPTHGQTPSQGRNVLPQDNSPQTTAPVYDTSLLTPPLTGLPSLVFDRQPNTPQSAAVVTPVKTSAVGTAAGKFEGLFAFLSSKSRRGAGEHGQEDREEGSPKSMKIALNGGEEERAVTAPNGTPSGVVYGLAL